MNYDPYHRGGALAKKAWFEYKDFVKDSTRPAKCVVDFVAGFNAGSDPGSIAMLEELLAMTARFQEQMTRYDRKKFQEITDAVHEKRQMSNEG